MFRLYYYAYTIDTYHSCMLYFNRPNQPGEPWSWYRSARIPANRAENFWCICRASRSGIEFLFSRAHYLTEKSTFLFLKRCRSKAVPIMELHMCKKKTTKLLEKGDQHRIVGAKTGLKVILYSWQPGPWKTGPAGSCNTSLKVLSAKAGQ